MFRNSKLIGQFLLVSLALFMVAVSVVKVRAEGVSAQMKEEVVVKNDQMAEVGTPEVIREEVNYYLPYPGILPDHPLYWAKMLRDRVEEWRLFDPARKAEYWVFLADKRIGAGKVLVEGGKGELGVTTYQKASKYLIRAVSKIEELKRDGKEMGALANRIELATQKYLEILDRSASKNEDLRGQIEEVKKEVSESRARILVVLGRS